MKKNYMFTPGPTMVPAEVLLEEAQPLIHHRTPQFSEVLREIGEGLKELFGTSEDVYLITGSGTAAMEAAVANTCSPNDTAICVKSGKFGERWAELAEAYRCNVVNFDLEWGKSFTADQAEKLLQQHPEASVLCVTHSETSTGALTDIERIAKVTSRTDTLLIVDTITSIGVHAVEMDKWGADVMVGGSQKGCMVPPGLSFIAASQRAWSTIEAATSPRYYLDMRAMRKKWSEFQTPYTGPVSLARALRKALHMMRAEGLENIYERHARLAEAVRESMKAIGLELLPENPANGLTSVLAPEGIDSGELVSKMRDEYGVTIAGGQGHLKGKIFRIGHMGYISKEDLLVCISAVERGLQDLGYAFEFGSAVSLTQKLLFEK